MEYHANGWLGRWQNFEAYLTSSDPYLTRAWQDAETAAAAMPMFCGGVKAFWQRACVTTSSENPHTLGGWNIIMASGEKLCIEWLDRRWRKSGQGGVSSGKRVGKRSGRQGERSVCGGRYAGKLAFPLPVGHGTHAAPHGPPDRRPAEPPALPVCQPAKPACGPGDPETAQSHVVCHRLRWRWFSAGKVQHCACAAPSAGVGCTAGTLNQRFVWRNAAIADGGCRAVVAAVKSINEIQ